MRYFAQINNSGTVVQTTAAEPAFLDIIDDLPILLYPTTTPLANGTAAWVEMAFDGSYRGKSASVGDTYDPVLDVFVTYPDLATAQLALAKSASYAAVDQAHSDNIQTLQGNPTQIEKDSRDAKLAWAQAIIAAPTAVLSAPCTAYFAGLGLTTAAQQLAWAQMVIPKAAFCAQVFGLADALRSATKAAIDAATTPAQVQAALDAARAQAAQAVATVTASLTPVASNMTSNVSGNITGNTTL